MAFAKMKNLMVSRLSPGVTGATRMRTIFIPVLLYSGGRQPNKISGMHDIMRCTLVTHKAPEILVV